MKCGHSDTVTLRLNQNSAFNLRGSVELLREFTSRVNEVAETFDVTVTSDPATLLSCIRRRFV